MTFNKTTVCPSCKSSTVTTSKWEECMDEVGVEEAHVHIDVCDECEAKQEALELAEAMENGTYTGKTRPYEEFLAEMLENPEFAKEYKLQQDQYNAEICTKCESNYCEGCNKLMS